MITDTDRYDAVRRRDRTADGRFFYAVRTTGVYCRPSCAARLARPENVSFHPTAAAAEQAGFRPCKRCRPNEASQAEHHAALVRAACRTIDDAEEGPTLADLAASAGLSRFHFHRVFRAVTGVTPKAYPAAAPRPAPAPVARLGRHRDGGALRCRLQRPQPLLRGCRRPPRHGSRHLPRRRQGRGDPLRRGPVLAGCRAGGGDRQGRVRDQPGRGPGPGCCGSCRIASPHATLLGADPAFEATVARVVGLLESPSRPVDLPLEHPRHRLPAARLAGPARVAAG